MSRKSIVPTEDLLPNVLSVLDLIVPSIKPPYKKGAMKPVRDHYTYALQELVPVIHVKTVGKQCVDLVNQSLKSHRYEEAIKLLYMLSQDTAVNDNFIFKATMIVLENLQFCEKGEVIHGFVKQVLNLSKVNKKEVALEYVMSGLRNNFAQLSNKIKEFNFPKSVRKNDSIDSLLEAYTAYLEYESQLYSNRSDFQESQVSQISMEGIISKFQSLIKTPGDWDVFVLKLIEMLDSPGKHEEILFNYVEANPRHLNAHIYLCEYLNKNDPDSENLILHLKIIAELNPGDERVLLLLEKWNECDEEFMNCLQLLFLFLDYPFNGKNIKAWEMLTKLLLQVKSKKMKKEVRKTYWKSRCYSWQWIHFNSSKLHYLNETDFPLVAFKISVLSYFNEDHEYIKEIYRRFPEISRQLN